MVAKIGVDSSANEPLKIWVDLFSLFSPLLSVHLSSELGSVCTVPSRRAKPIYEVPLVIGPQQKRECCQRPAQAYRHKGPAKQRNGKERRNSRRDTLTRAGVTERTQHRSRSAPRKTQDRRMHLLKKRKRSRREKNLRRTPLSTSPGKLLEN